MDVKAFLNGQANARPVSPRQHSEPRSLGFLFDEAAKAHPPQAKLKQKTARKKPALQKAPPQAPRKEPRIFEKKREDWARRRLELVERYTNNKYLLEHHLGQLKLEQERVPGNNISSTTTEQLQEEPDPPNRRVLTSEQQRQVAEHPPDIPLSVRAGAGTGKTQTMVTRAIKLVTLHKLNPGSILLLTFTNRAAGELLERVKAEFEKNVWPQTQGDTGLPMVKTFHSLAYSWIRTFWKECGLGKYPSLLVTPPQQKSFMKKVMECHVKEMQLERCSEFLSASLSIFCITWEKVVDTMRKEYPKEYKMAQENAEAALKKGKKGTKTKQKATPKKKGEAETHHEAEMRLLMRSQLERECYLELLRRHKNDPETTCDLEFKREADKEEQCKFYLKMIKKARLGQHEPSEYLPSDAQILTLYERMQERTGNIDFDKLLNLFVQLLDADEAIKKVFLSTFNYIIVDEYQDNSEVQSQLLFKIVTQGRVTVVGDDDQCIYEFRGASAGNFEAFREHFQGLELSPQEKLLEDNYRSTGNILKVGTSFLEGMFKRGVKTLRATKEAGKKVLLWECLDEKEQTKKIAMSVKKAHEKDGIAWSEMACLFRCFRTTRGILHRRLQEEFAINKIPFRVVGGDSFLNSEIIRDLLAYMKLTLTGSQERMDDDSFARILNKPPRGLPIGALELIRAQQSTMEEDGLRNTSVGLEEAAMALMENDHMLTKGRSEGLKNLFRLLHEFRVAANCEALPSLVLRIWDCSGLAGWHETKAANKKKSEIGQMEGADCQAGEESGIGDNEDAENQGQPQAKSQNKDECEIRGSAPSQGKAKDKPKYRPENVLILVAVASAHADTWKESKAPVDDSRRTETLFNLAKNCLIERATENPYLPQQYLPQPLLDELHMPGAKGIAVVNSFLADLALQMNGDGAESDMEEDRVTISTIHRAKGLEWEEVYVPFFNDGLMPTKFREDDDPRIPARHLRTCPLRRGKGGPLDRCGCAQHYADLESKRRDMTAEQRHTDEERRLAHVAATRAKTCLVFLSLRNAPSPFKNCLCQ